MAKAFVAVLQTTNRPSDSSVEFLLCVNFFGSDVDPTSTIAGPHKIFSGIIALSNSATQIKNSIVAVAISKAASLGLTVANGDTLITDLTFI